MKNLSEIGIEIQRPSPQNIEGLPSKEDVDTVKRNVLENALDDVEKEYGNEYPLEIEEEGRKYGVAKPETLANIEDEMIKATEDLKKSLENI